MQTPYRKPGKYANKKHDPLLTEEKVNALKNRLKKLKELHPKLTAEVAKHAEMGDFSENAEYQHAKWQLRRTNRSIQTIENRLNHAVIVKPPKQNNTVDLYHKVTVKIGNEKKTFQILGSSETNPKKGIISNQSPIGLALMGKKVGDKVRIILAKKEVEYEIISIK